MNAHFACQFYFWYSSKYLNLSSKQQKHVFHLKKSVKQFDIPKNLSACPSSIKAAMQSTERRTAIYFFFIYLYPLFACKMIIHHMKQFFICSNNDTFSYDYLTSQRSSKILVFKHHELFIFISYMSTGSNSKNNGKAFV